MVMQGAASGEVQRGCRHWQICYALLGESQPFWTLCSPAVRCWLTLGASGGVHDPDTQQRHLVLGMSPVIVLPIFRLLGSAIALQVDACYMSAYTSLLMMFTQACHECKTLASVSI